MSTVKQRLAEEVLPVEAYLRECLKGRHIPCELVTAMEYSLLAGGKRVRPALCLACGKLFGLAAEPMLPFVSALELIHTYSLIHDDLPALDNDDLRRGRPSNHKKFDEATAILAGDGLLTEAFVLMSRTARDLPAERVLTALGLVAEAAGAAGMVGGQELDMLYTGKPGLVRLEDLRYMHALKTGALLKASCLSGAILAGAGAEDLKRVESFGRHLGAAFQIMDDVLDEVGDEASLGKPVGSDREQGKSTYPSLLGLEESKRLAAEHIDEALAELEPYSGETAGFLRELARYIVDRAS